LNQPVRITGHTVVSFEPVNINVDHAVKINHLVKVKITAWGKIMKRSVERYGCICNFW